jgi:hypothetical protein
LYISQFQQASSLLDQVSETHDPKTFVEASSHPDWDTTMNEEYCSLMEMILGILYLFQKEENLSNVNGCIELSMHQMEVLKDIRPD